LLVVSHGAPGVIRAIEECFPRSPRQRCLAHKMRQGYARRAQSRLRSPCRTRDSVAPNRIPNPIIQQEPDVTWGGIDYVVGNTPSHH
jgi:hypothetical protein